MMTKTETHPDFLRSGSELSSRQVAWLKSNGIRAIKGERYGFYFDRGGDVWIEPIAATDHLVYLMEVDRSEDGDGVRCVETFDRLRDALRALATR